MNAHRRGVILPVILFVLLLLGLFGAMFSFRIHADVWAVQASANRLQTRLAAEAGIAVVKSLLRTARLDRTQWYHNPEAFHRVLVWAHESDSREAGTTDELAEKMAYRFSIVADDSTEDKKYLRFGLTDEASKLNLNTVTADQLLRLLQQTLASEEDVETGVDPQSISDAIMDWRDSDNKPSGDAAGTEGEYYLALDHPYMVKNGPFSSVEELLLVKGVTGSVLYGEDFDRNGLLTPNEDDGEDSFPPDNQDGVLNQGLYPYLTVFSYETDLSSENQQKVYLFSDEATLKKQLDPLFPDDPEKVKFILAVTRGGAGPTSGGGKAPGPKGPTTGTGSEGKPGTPESGGPVTPGAGQPPGNPPSGPKPRPGPTGPTPPKPIKKEMVSQKAQQPGSPANPSNRPGMPQSQGPGNRPGNGRPPAPGGQPPPGAPRGEVGAPNTGDQPPPGDAENEDQKPPDGAGSGDEQGGSGPIRSPASLLLPRKNGAQLEPSPFTSADLPLLMDRLTTTPPSKDRKAKGLININTASRTVLKCLEGLTDEQIDSILAARDGLDEETAASPTWPMTEGIVEDVAAFDKVVPYLTAKGQQFTIESLGYADHMGMVTRLQVVVDMVGPIAQTIYTRDLSYLGGSYPIREEDKEQIRGR